MDEKNNPQKYFRYFNFFSRTNGVYFDNELKYRNTFGMLLSVGVIVILFFFIYQFIFYEAYTVETNMTSNSAESVDLSNIPFLIRLLPKNGNHIFPGCGIHRPFVHHPKHDIGR